MNALRAGDDIAPLSFLPKNKVIGAESFHPTPAGHARMASTIEQETRDFWYDFSCNSCSDQTTPVSYWGDFTLSSVGYSVAMQFLKAGTYLAEELLQLELDEETFAANSTATVTIFSDPTELGVYQTAQDGSLSLKVAIPPSVEPGYHTVHVVGRSDFGEKVDVYQTIFIAGEEIIVDGGGANTNEVLVEDEKVLHTAEVLKKNTNQQSILNTVASAMPTLNSTADMTKAPQFTSNVKTHFSPNVTNAKSTGVLGRGDDANPIDIGLVIYGIVGCILILLVCMFLFRTYK